jgi:hypothetical protein
VGAAEGELTERVGDEDAILLGGVIEIVGGLELLRGIVAALQDGVVMGRGGWLRLLCGDGKASRDGQKTRPYGVLRAHLEVVHREDPIYGWSVALSRVRADGVKFKGNFTRQKKKVAEYATFLMEALIN